MSNRLKAEVWDKMQFLFRNFYDRTMHAAMVYDGKIDIEKMSDTLTYMVNNVPVLHSTFHNDPIKPYWTKNEFTINDFLTVVDIDEDKLWDEIYAFLEQSVDYRGKVQTYVRIFNFGEKSAIAFVFNHMCFDGGDLKYYLGKLCENYKAACAGEPFVKIKSGSRSCDAVYTNFTPEEEAAARKLYKNVSAVHDHHTFPLSPNTPDDKLSIIVRQLDPDLFTAFRKIGKANGLTVNDLMLGAYVHSLYEYAEWNKTDSLHIPCMVDLRRHIKNGGAEFGLANHTGFMVCAVDCVGNTVTETMKKVAESNNRNKDDKFLGLYSIPLLKLAYKVFPQCIAEIAIKIGYDNPLIGMSNIGQMTHDLDLGNITMTDGFMTGAVKYKPYMQLALITVLGVMKMSICIRGNDRDREMVNKFFDIYEANIKKFIEENK